MSPLWCRSGRRHHFFLSQMQKETHKRKVDQGKVCQKQEKESCQEERKDFQKETRQEERDEDPGNHGEPVDDGYDGYYNDVLPPDKDRISDGLDKELVKNIVVLGIGFTVIVGLCVALLYVL